MFDVVQSRTVEVWQILVLSSPFRPWLYFCISVSVYFAHPNIQLKVLVLPQMPLKFHFFILFRQMQRANFALLTEEGKCGTSGSCISPQ